MECRDILYEKRQSIDLLTVEMEPKKCCWIKLMASCPVPTTRGRQSEPFQSSEGFFVRFVDLTHLFCL